MIYDSHKMTWCNFKHFAENHDQLTNLHSIIVSRILCIIYQLLTTTVSNTSIIFVRKTHLTAALCIYIVVLYLFYIKAIVDKHICFTFKQMIMIRKHMRTCGTLKKVTENSNFQACLFYNAFLYWNLLIVLTFLY